MSKPADAPTLGQSGLTVIVKGGTTSARYDEEQAKRKAQSELGREHQDKQMAAASRGDQMTSEGFVSSRLHSLRLMDSGAPKVVLYYLNRDGTVRQSCVSEFVMLPDGDELFTMVCPKCLERGVAQGDCQLQVRKSHRKWYRDPKKEGTLVLLEDPFGKPFQVRICGTIYSEETLRCTNFNCNWAVRIEDSKVVAV